MSSASAAQVSGQWYAVPDFFISIPVLWRKDLFASVGMGEPKTWEDLRKAAGQLKGQQLGFEPDIGEHLQDVCRHPLLTQLGGDDVDAYEAGPIIGARPTRSGAARLVEDVRADLVDQTLELGVELRTLRFQRVSDLLPIPRKHVRQFGCVRCPQRVLEVHHVLMELSHV